MLHIYNNKKFITQTEENKVLLKNLHPNIWYDNLTITYSYKGVESKHIGVPSFKTKHRKEIILDIARRYLSLETLKSVIDTIYANGGRYLQLYISDNKRFGIYSEYLQQTETEPNTNYLTKQEITELVNYANQKGVLITPNIDVPGHSGGWLSIVKELYPDKTIASDFDETLVDFWYNEDAYEAVKTIIKETTELFKQDVDIKPRFNIGADESAGAESNQPAYVDFINYVSEYLTSLGYQTIIWNDSIYEKGLPRLNRDIEIYYWKKAETGLEAKTLAKDNRDLTNCNFYSTTFMPQSKFTDSDIEWQQNYIKEKFHTDLFCEGYDTTQIFVDIESPLSVRGSAMVFWNENSLDLDEKQYLNQILPLIETYLTVA